MTDYLKPEECKIGYLYRIHARNFRYGVYVGGETGGFVGVREKFGSEYLFTEYHWDLGGSFGTVQPIEEIAQCGIRDRSESFLLCDRHKMPVVMVLEDGQRQDLHYDGTELEDGERSLIYTNQPLFDFLKKYEEECEK